MEQMAGAFQAGLQAVGPDNALGRQRLEAALRFLRFYEKEVQGMLGRWHQQQAA